MDESKSENGRQSLPPPAAAIHFLTTIQELKARDFYLVYQQPVLLYLP